MLVLNDLHLKTCDIVTALMNFESPVFCASATGRRKTPSTIMLLKYFKYLILKGYSIG